MQPELVSEHEATQGDVTHQTLLTITSQKRDEPLALVDGGPQAKRLALNKTVTTAKLNIGFAGGKFECVLHVVTLLLKFSSISSTINVK